MDENKQILKEKFIRGKELGQIVNNARSKIESLKNKVFYLKKNIVVKMYW